MKHQTKLITTLLITFLSIFQGFSQMDTLHLYYSGLQVKMADSTEAKITAWVKSLNGQHVDLNVVAYYSESDYKKFSAERCDELFIILNRKARSLINIVTNEPKKGKKFQRSTVDIIYKRNGVTANSSEKTTITKNDGKSNSSSVSGQKTNTSQKNDSKSNSPVNNVAQKNESEKNVDASNSNAFVARDAFKSRKLMIVLLEESQDQLDRLKEKPEELSIYKNNVKLHNDNITKAFKTFWKLSEVGFIKESELESTNIEEKAINWVLLLPGKAEIKNVPFMTYNLNMVYREVKKCYITDALFKISLRDEMPNEGDFLVLMNKMKLYYGAEKEFDLNQLEETLAKKTLYVDASMTEITKEEFKEEYPFPFVYSTSEEIKNNATKGDKDLIYFKIDVYEGMINLMIINAETGAIISRSQMSGISGPSSGNFLSIKNNINNNDTQMNYLRCSFCPISGNDLLKNFIDKAKIKKAVLRDLANEKKQIKYSDPLTIY